MILKGDNQEIELKVTGYEYPHPTKSYWDNNWLMLYCGKKFGGYTAANRLACFLTVELKRLHCLLEEFSSGRSDGFDWGGTEPNLAISMRRRQDVCTLDILCYLEDGEEMPGVIEAFHKEASNGDIQLLKEFCMEALEQYPERNVGVR